MTIYFIVVDFLQKFPGGVRIGNMNFHGDNKI